MGSLKSSIVFHLLVILFMYEQ